jgi:hypothetical protein
MRAPTSTHHSPAPRDQASFDRDRVALREAAADGSTEGAKPRQHGAERGTGRVIRPGFDDRQFSEMWDGRIIGPLLTSRNDRAQDPF